jgi:hypothetical protein
MSTSVLFGDTASKYGGALARPTQATRDDSQLPAVAGPSRASQAAAYHPSSGLFWFGAIAAAAVGLAYASTTVRVGPAKASVSLGKS